MELNFLANVQLHQLGLADRDATLTLYMIDKPNYGLGTFSTADQYDLPLRAATTCAVRHASNYLRETGINMVDAVKIDVQGFEPEVLRGLHTVLERDRPLIWCEIGSGTLEKIETVAKLQALLPTGYQCYRFVEVSNWLVRSTVLKQTTSVLPSGDYLLMPAKISQ